MTAPTSRGGSSGSTVTPEEVLHAAHTVMQRCKRSWVRASDIYLELIAAAPTSTPYRNRQDLIRGERIYYILRTNGFVRDNTGSRCRRDPRYNYTGGDGDYMPGADNCQVWIPTND